MVFIKMSKSGILEVIDSNKKIRRVEVIIDFDEIDFQKGDTFTISVDTSVSLNNKVFPIKRKIKVERFGTYNCIKIIKREDSEPTIEVLKR